MESPVVELDASGNVAATNTSGAGVLSRRSGGASVFYTFDERGSVVQRMDGFGGALSSHLYDAYGVGSSSVATGDPFGFGGQWGYYPDAETGLELCTFRYYSSGAGRWLSRDPISHEGGVNLYGYVGSDPVGSVDPLGLKPSQPWYDGLANIARGGGEGQKSLINDYWTGRPGGVAIATVANSAIDVVVGALAFPSDIGHLGEGAGTYFGDPSERNLPGLLGDIGTVCSIGLGGVAPAARGMSGTPLRVTFRMRRGAVRKIGPSGKPVIHLIRHKSKKEACEAARHAGKGKPMHHPHPKGGHAALSPYGWERQEDSGRDTP
jgi:RHS repeat-associated protein